MNSKELDSMNIAFEKYPTLRPYFSQLRRLCFEDMPGGVNIRSLHDQENGIPWTIMLAGIIKYNQDIVDIPESESLNVPMFIIEVQKQMQTGTDYSLLISRTITTTSI